MISLYFIVAVLLFGCRAWTTVRRGKPTEEMRNNEQKVRTMWRMGGVAALVLAAFVGVVGSVQSLKRVKRALSASQVLSSKNPLGKVLAMYLCGRL